MTDETETDSIDIEHQFEPTCPECGADGLRQRRSRSQWRCLECGHRYEDTATTQETNE